MELIPLEGAAGQTEPATWICSVSQARKASGSIKGSMLFKFIELGNGLKQQNINPGSL